MFPGVVLHFDIGRKKSILAVQDAIESNRLIFLATQKKIKDEKPCKEDIYSVGVLAKVKQVLKQTDEYTRVLVEGICRARAVEYFDKGKFVKADVEKIENTSAPDTLQTEALLRQGQELFAEYLHFLPNVPDDLFIGALSIKNIGKAADYIASNVILSFEQKQELLAELDEQKRMQKLIMFLFRENQLSQYESEFADKLKKSIDKNQKEYYIKEQIKLLSSELNENSDPITESQKYLNKLEKLKLPKDTYDKLKRECINLSKVSVGSPEAGVIDGYLETVFSLPWNKSTCDVLDIQKSKKILNSEHYGLQEVKNRIIEFLAVKKMSANVKGQIICLIGPPGVGKTSVVKSLAKSMGRKYVRISLGGVNDESEIRGHRKTYIGAMPGRIISALRQAKSNNPIILLDEIDKLLHDYHGDPSSALLEALDPAQNVAFCDHYIEVPFDLSNVIFVATANDKSSIPPALYDRMEVIDMYSYNFEEKFCIAKEHIIPKQLKINGLNKRIFSINDQALKNLIAHYTKEAGVRELERNIASLMRKSATKIVEGECKKVAVDEDMLVKMLGAPKYKNEDIFTENEVGVVRGLAWTAVGGETMPIEAVLMKGKGKMHFTGSLGDVMKESAQLAVSYIRSNCKTLGVDEKFFDKFDIHIHAPEGAVPKDGPSAGVTMVTALVSALTGRKVDHNIAMTGEITLKGKVLPIGGLKEKSMAAYKAGVKKVIIPVGNKHDIEKLDEIVKSSIEFVLADKIDVVLANSLI